MEPEKLHAPTCPSHCDVQESGECVTINFEREAEGLSEIGKGLACLSWGG